MVNQNDKLTSLTNQYNSVLSQYQISLEGYIKSLNTNVDAKNSSTPSAQTQKYQQEIQSLNEQLIVINKQIIVVVNQTSGEYQTDMTDNVKIHKTLGKNYHELINERNHVNRIINQSTTLQGEIDNSGYYTTESYSRYILLLGITIVLFFLLFKYCILSNNQTGGGESKIKTDVIYLLCIMIVFLGLANILKNMNVLIFITIALIIFLLIKIKMPK